MHGTDATGFNPVSGFYGRDKCDTDRAWNGDTVSAKEEIEYALKHPEDENAQDILHSTIASLEKLGTQYT